MDLIDRQAAISRKLTCVISGQITDVVPVAELTLLPSAQPETHDKRTETHACDLISRQAVLALPRSITRNMKGNVVEESIDVEMIKTLPPAQSEPQWIPCSERLPEIDEEVLVTDGEIYWVCSLFKSTDIEDGLYQWEDNYGHWHEFDTWIAWMPLPTPYREENDDERIL